VFVCDGSFCDAAAAVAAGGGEDVGAGDGAAPVLGAAAATVATGPVAAADPERGAALPVHAARTAIAMTSADARVACLVPTMRRVIRANRCGTWQPRILAERSS
jgi:hypothetical protein